MRTTITLALLVFLSGCIELVEWESRRPVGPTGRTSTGQLSALREEWDTLVAGGDTVIARREHDYVARNGYDWPLAEVAPLLEEADATLVNLETCVALTGFPAEKGERNPCYFRARPEMLNILVRAGVDSVTMANNHGADYGPFSAAETLKWTGEAGLVCVGGGLDVDQAQTPKLIMVGRTRVALAGIDTTMPAFCVGTSRPGINHAPEGDLEIFEERVRRLGEWARGRCDLLVLTIHWGRNWDRKTSQIHRHMARMAFGHGVDLILGHSAHRLQGVEVIDGKFVVYDMGNLLLDGVYGKEGQLTGIFRFRISPRGVHRLEFLPAWSEAGRTRLPQRGENQAIMQEMSKLCRAMDTPFLWRQDGEGNLLGVILPLSGPGVTKRPPVQSNLGFARFPAGKEVEACRPASVLCKTIPGVAKILKNPVELAPDVELLAYCLPTRVTQGQIMEVRTWWRVKNKLPFPWLVSFELVSAGRVVRSAWYNRHDPGDWTMPLRWLEPGEIVEDRFPLRLGRTETVPAGPCQVRAMVLDPRMRPNNRQLAPPHILGTVSVDGWPN